MILKKRESFSHCNYHKNLSHFVIKKLIFIDIDEDNKEQWAQLPDVKEKIDLIKKIKTDLQD